VFSKTIFFFENRIVYDIMWKRRRQMIIWRMRIVSCITKVTDTQSEYVIFIAFPLQKRYHERASLLHHTYIVYLVDCTTNQPPMTVNFNVAVFMALTPRELADRHQRFGYVWYIDPQPRRMATMISWRWRQHVPPKYRHTFGKVYGVAYRITILKFQ
jgi:hypothetical protein